MGDNKVSKKRNNYTERQNVTYSVSVQVKKAVKDVAKMQDRSASSVARSILRLGLKDMGINVEEDL